MKRYLMTILTIFISFIYANSVQAQSKTLTRVSPESAGFSSSRLERLDSGMNNWVKNKWVNGSVALIARNGKIVFEFHPAFFWLPPSMLHTKYGDIFLSAFRIENNILRHHAILFTPLHHFARQDHHSVAGCIFDE